MKRWIIRSFFIGLLLLCVGGWAWSLIWRETIACSYDRGARIFSADILRGKLHLCKGYGPDQPDGWGYEHASADDPYLEWALSARQFNFIGIELFGSQELIIPLWFLSLLAAAVLWLACLMTRLPVKGGAFPVEAIPSIQAK